MKKVCIFLVTDSLGMSSLNTNRKHLFFSHREMKSDMKGLSLPKSMVPNLWHKILNFVSPCYYSVFSLWLCWGCHLVSSERPMFSVTYAYNQCVLQNACRLLHLSCDWAQTAKLSTSQWILLSHADPWQTESCHSRTNSENYLLTLNQALSCG